MARDQSAHGLRQEQGVARGGAVQRLGQLGTGRVGPRDRPQVLVDLARSQRIERDAFAMACELAQLALAACIASIPLRRQHEHGLERELGREERKQLQTARVRPVQVV